MSIYRFARVGPPAYLLFLVAAACSSSPELQAPGSSQEGGAPIDSGSTPNPQPDAASPVGTSDGASNPPVGTPDAQSDDASSVAPAPDAGLETGTPGPTGPDASMETIMVPANATGAMSQATLTQGAMYLLKAVGSVDVGGQKADAEYGFAPDGTGATDMVGGVDVGIDVGMLQPNAMNHTTIVPPGPGRMKWYGVYRTDHTYYLWLTGQGKPLTLKLATQGMASGSGTIAVSLFFLQPPPPAMYVIMDGPTPAPPAAPKIGRDSLETVQVPMVKTSAAGKTTTDPKAVYLVEASGTGIVSKAGGMFMAGPGHMGDAEYMDWPLDGSKFNDGESGGDFGIGVDEPVAMGPPSPISAYTHRLGWWGPYRNDHVYYMLKAGNGQPFSFLYIDSGYGDNSPTDTLTVRIFPVP